MSDILSQEPRILIQRPEQTTKLLHCIISEAGLPWPAQIRPQFQDEQVSLKNLGTKSLVRALLQGSSP